LLVNIQFLRFVAAVLVLVYHTAARVPGMQHWTHGLFAVGDATGFAGVDVFFVISGFIMAHTTRGDGGPADAWSFARRRVARIYSGYWPFFVLALAVFAWTRPMHFAESRLAASLLLWPQSLNLNLLELTWTLSFEMYFYVLFTALVWLVPARQRLAACLAVLVPLAAFNGIRHVLWQDFSPARIYGLSFADQFLTSPFILEFFAGAVLAYRLEARPGRLGWTWLALGAGLFLAGGLVNQLIFGGDIEQGYHVVPRVALFGVASVLIVTGLVRLEQRQVIAPVRFSLVAGGASYAIYLAHVPLLATAQQLGLGRWARQQPPSLAALAYSALMVAIVLLSIAHYRRLERPLHRLFRRWLRVPGSSGRSKPV